MSSGNSEIEIESGRLRSGKIFQLGKRRRTVTRRGSCSATEGKDYELVSHLERGYYDEDEYHLIYEEVIEEEAPNPDQDYDIPMSLHTSPKVRSRNTSPKVRLRYTSPSGFANLINGKWK